MPKDNEDNDDLQEQIAEVAAEQAEAEQNQVEEPENEDEAEWLAARAELKASEEGKGADPEPEPEPKAEEPPEAKPEEPKAEDEQPKAVPFARFKEVNDERKQFHEKLTEAERAAIYWRGVAEGRVQPEGKQPEPELEPDPVAALEAEQDALAKRYDDGEIGMAEFNKENRRLTRDIQKAEASREAKPEPKEPEFDEAKFQQELADDLSVQNAFREIAEANPWLNQPTRGRQIGLREDLAELNDRAYELAKTDGVTINTRQKRGVIIHRAYLMAAAHEAGLPEKYGWTPPKPADPQPEAKRPAQPPGSPTPEQRKAKAELRKSHPGDPTQAGQAGAPGHEPTAAEIEEMSDEELDALPASVLAKYRA